MTYLGYNSFFCLEDFSFLLIFTDVPLSLNGQRCLLGVAVPDVNTNDYFDIPNLSIEYNPTQAFSDLSNLVNRILLEQRPGTPHLGAGTMHRVRAGERLLCLDCLYLGCPPSGIFERTPH